MEEHSQRYERLRRKLILLRSAIRGLKADAAELAALVDFTDDILFEEVFTGLLAAGDPRAVKLVEQRRAEKLAEQSNEVH